jgi:hypothetical protein
MELLRQPPHALGGLGQHLAHRRKRLRELVGVAGPDGRRQPVDRHECGRDGLDRVLVQLGGDPLALDLLGAQEVVQGAPPLSSQVAHLGGDAGEEPRTRRDRGASDRDQQREPLVLGVVRGGGPDPGAEQAREHQDEDGKRGLRVSHDLPLGLARGPAHR